MRIAIVYDCLYPNTVGGAERWLRSLAEDLARDHAVTYVTRKQWNPGEEPAIEGVTCVAVSPGGLLYTRAGRRRLLPIALYGIGVFLHFLRHRRGYDVVHCVSYPFSSLIAARVALAGQRQVRVYCEWLEYLSSHYWRAYAGPVGGAAGRLIQKLCLRVTPAAFAFSDLVESRLRAAGFRGQIHRLPGLWAGDPSRRRAGSSTEKGALILFAGRHVADKRPTLVPDLVLAARRRRPELRAVIVGDGPERKAVLERIKELDLDGAVDAPGFVERDALEGLLARAACVVSPSVRDGYGMIVAEAAAHGVPVVVSRHPDSAATELVEDGVNGAIAATPDAEGMARAVLQVLEKGDALRRSTTDWFEAHAERLAMTASIEAVRGVYGGTRSRLSGSSAERRPLDSPQEQAQATADQ